MEGRRQDHSCTNAQVDQVIAERLERVMRIRNRTRLVERLLQIGPECAALPVLDDRSPEDMLYDERGVPR